MYLIVELDGNMIFLAEIEISFRKKEKTVATNSAVYPVVDFLIWGLYKS